MTFITSPTLRNQKPPARKPIDPDRPPLLTLDGLIRDNPVVVLGLSDSVFTIAAKRTLIDLGAHVFAIDLDKLTDHDFHNHCPYDRSGNPVQIDPLFRAPARTAPAKGYNAPGSNSGTTATNVGLGGSSGDGAAACLTYSPSARVLREYLGLADGEGLAFDALSRTSSRLDAFLQPRGSGMTQSVEEKGWRKVIADFLVQADDYQFRSTLARRLWAEAAIETGQCWLPSVFIGQTHVAGISGMHELGSGRLSEMIQNAAGPADEPVKGPIIPGWH